MSLVTRCPHCATAFKVVADQLRVRNGLVRCGVCNTVFDGRACLVTPGEPDPATRAPLPVVEQAVPMPPTPAAVPGPAAEPVPAPAVLRGRQAMRQAEPADDEGQDGDQDDDAPDPASARHEGGDFHAGRDEAPWDDARAWTIGDGDSRRGGCASRAWPPSLAWLMRPCRMKARTWLFPASGAHAIPAPPTAAAPRPNSSMTTGRARAAWAGACGRLPAWRPSWPWACSWSMSIAAASPPTCPCCGPCWRWRANPWTAAWVMCGAWSASRSRRPHCARHRARRPAPPRAARPWCSMWSCAIVSINPSPGPPWCWS